MHWAVGHCQARRLDPLPLLCQAMHGGIDDPGSEHGTFDRVRGSPGVDHVLDRLDEPREVAIWRAILNRELRCNGSRLILQFSGEQELADDTT